MAEVFGIVAGALSVAALFNNCVDSFGYIQLGRQFGQDYEICQLRLDIAEARLMRWGEAVKINDDRRFDTSLPTDDSILLARSILEQIALLFESAKRKSKQYELVTEQQDPMLRGDRNMWPVSQGLHNRLRKIIHQRQKQTSLVKKTAWALYDAKSLEGILDNIARFIDDLEKVFPVDNARRILVGMEIEDVSDEPSLETLKNAAQGIDATLSDAAGEKMNTIASQNLANEVSMEDSAKLQVGNTFSVGVLGRETIVRDQTANTLERVAAKGQSGIQIGNVYGGKGIWD